MKVTVIGGGVVGLCCAHFLRRGGAEVTVVERNACGQAASFRNAGWITQSLSAPMSAPGVMRQALLWMGRADSPFLLRPRRDTDFYRWAWRFARSCSRKSHRAGSEALVALNRNSLSLLDELRASGLEFEMHDAGLLFVAFHRDVVDGYVAELLAVQRAGYEGSFEVFDRRGILAFEPALSDEIAGGVYVPGDRHVRPEAFTRALVDDLHAHGATVIEGQEVQSLSRAASGWLVRTPAEDIASERVVVAAGAWSTQLLAGLGLRLSIEAAKGYSITARIQGGAPKHALYLAEAKVGCSPFDEGIRFAGTLELAGIDETLVQQRLRPLAQAASRYLREWRPLTEPVEWAGLRPLPADGLPYIGPAPTLPGLYVATGHGTLGMALAPATGAALAPLILEDRHEPELWPFRLDRPM